MLSWVCNGSRWKPSGPLFLHKLSSWSMWRESSRFGQASIRHYLLLFSHCLLIELQRVFCLVQNPNWHRHHSFGSSKPLTRKSNYNRLCNHWHFVVTALHKSLTDYLACKCFFATTCRTNIDWLKYYEGSPRYIFPWVSFEILWHTAPSQSSLLFSIGPDRIPDYVGWQL